MFLTIVFYFLSFVLATAFLLEWLYKQTRYRKVLDKIPGPTPLPLIGSVHEVIFREEGALFRVPRKFAKQFGPIYRAWLGPICTIHISGAEDVEVIVSGLKHNSKGVVYDFMKDWLGTGLLISDGSKWHSRRKLLTPAFHFSILQRFLSTFAEQTDNLVKSLEKECKKPYTVLEKIVTSFTLSTICETAMGARLFGETDNYGNNRERYREGVDEMGKIVVFRALRPWFHVNWTYMFSPVYWREKKLLKVLHDFSRGVIKMREEIFEKNGVDIPDDADDDEEEADEVYSKKKRLAMLDLLLSAKAKGADIDDEGIREEVDTFMFEGHDTTAISLIMTMMLIAAHPEAQEKIVSELENVFGDSDRQPTYKDLQNLSYLEMCIKESLRLYPSVPLIARIAGEEFTTATGYTIPKNCLLVIHIFDVHRNPEIYPNPDEFIPERFTVENSKNRHPYAYMPFSAGPRNCIGQKFALMEMKTVLSGILRKFRLEAVDKPSDVEPIYGVILRSSRDVRVRFRPRKGDVAV